MRILGILILMVPAFIFAAEARTTDPVELAKITTKFVESAIKLHDIPATCWYMGQIRGYAVILKNAGNPRGEDFVKLTTDHAGRCGGNVKPGEKDFSKSFSDAEWARLSNWVKDVQDFN